MEKITFNDLIESDVLKAQLQKLGIVDPTPIQSLAIPKIKEGIDIIGQAQTGTGKTFAFGLPLLEKIDPKSDKVNALILCPTRELAIQVEGELKKVIGSTKIKLVTVYGGQSYSIQERALKSKPQIIIGTTGRTVDFLEKKKISFEHLETLILDEADEMLNMGFKEDIEKILTNAPKERQTVLFSATLPDAIKSIAKKFQNNPELLKVKAQTLTVDRIEQKTYYCYKESKKDLLVRLLDFYNFESSIIFCNTKACVDELVMLLQKYNFSVDGLHGDLKQLSRDRVMNAYRTGAIKILIATDVAARGLDIKNIKGVINYDLPTDNEVYVHRIGRTGRAGTYGTSISIVTPRQKNRIQEISKFTKSTMKEEKIPTIEDIRNNKSETIYQSLKDELDKTTELSNENLAVLNKLVKDNYTADQIVCALVNLLYSKDQRKYNEILTARPSNYSNNRRSGDSKQFDRRRPNKEFINVHLNIGKEQDVRPQALLAYLVSEAKVRKENIGDIRIKSNGTNLEVTKQAFNYLVKINGKKFKDKKIVITKV